MIRTIYTPGSGTLTQSGFLRLGYIVQPYYLLMATVFFLFIIATLILYVSVFLHRRKRNSKIKQRLKLQYSDIIGQAIISDSIEELHAIVQARSSALSQWLLHPFARKVFIDELFRASQMIDGSASANIVWLYNHFQLNTDTEKKLRSKHWNVVAKSIQRLAALNQKELTVRIYRFTNSNNDHIRQQAQAAVVKLKGFEGLRFLDITNKPIEKWQQLCLLQELSRHTGYEEAQLKKWLHSQNKSVVEFSLMLVQTYRCYELHDDVVTCLAHEDDIVKQQAIITLKEIAESNTATVIVAHFASCSPVIQLQILHMLLSTGSAKEIPFLTTMLDHSDNLFKLAAAKAIKNIQQNGLEIVQNKIAFLDEPWTQIIAQLKEEAA